MTLKHLAASFAEQHGLLKQQAETLLVSFFNQMAEHLKSGERVKIGGLGVIKVKNRPVRMGTQSRDWCSNPDKASKTIASRAAKELKYAT